MGLMFMPLLTYADGYGFTYGGRATFADVLGKRGRLTVPLTWGGVRRAAIEGEKRFTRGPFSARGSDGLDQPAREPALSAGRSSLRARGPSRARDHEQPPRRRRRRLDRRVLRRAGERRRYAGVRPRRSLRQLRRRCHLRHASRSDVPAQRHLSQCRLGRVALRRRIDDWPRQDRSARLCRAVRLVGAVAARALLACGRAAARLRAVAARRGVDAARLWRGNLRRRHAALRPPPSCGCR